MLFRCFKYLAAIFLCISSLTVSGQTNFRVKKIIVKNDTIQLDSLSIIPGSLILQNRTGVVDTSAYYLDPFGSILVFKPGNMFDTLTVSYRVYPLLFNKTYTHKSKDKFEPDPKTNTSVFKYQGNKNSNDYFDTEGLNKTGSISRGINFGNNQNLSVNSNLNLQLSGRIRDKVSVLASVTDDNIPIQPDGNTQQLQDFDQVYIKVFDKNWALTAGDFWMRRPAGYFLNYNKRVQGLSFENKLVKKDKFEYAYSVGSALSKGKFARNIIQGVEGNQGPYKLRGSENESFIIVLAGTEQVYIDGQAMQRGQENDYVIDYNTAEITFTPKRLITKDRRIIVEFQYSDKNYARSIITSTHYFKSEKMKAWLNLYSEQDAKNQSLQQTLTDEDKLIMANVGDSIQNAYNFSIDSVGFSNNLVLYKMIDSLGYDSVFVFSVNPDSAFYRLGFSFVGTGNGDYVQSTFTALGKTYKWIAPDTIGSTIVRKGNYAPINLLITPKRRQMVNGGIDYNFNKNNRVWMEIAYSGFDNNTFSKIHKSDDDGYALRAGYENKIPLQKNENPLQFTTNLSTEIVTSTFTFIERFRAVEFERNWNILNQKINSNQYIGDVEVGLQKKNYGRLSLGANTFVAGEEYTGVMGKLNGKYNHNGYLADVNASYLNTNSTKGTSFLRHKSLLSKSGKLFRVGFKDEHEYNRFYYSNADSIIQGSYRFYDWEIFAGTPDTAGNKFTVSYRQRLDWLADTGQLKKAAHADQYALNFDLVKNPKNILRGKIGYRELRIVDSSLTTQKADKTILGRLEHEMKLWKSFVSTSTFYEVGSGLELKREFIYIEVQSGQGNYSWIDYNENNIKELNEFEIAVFQDQANYIRSFVPTNEYVRTYTNQFNQTLNLNPGALWRNKTGFKKFLSRFNDQAYYRVERKTSNEDVQYAFNPFRKDIADTNLVTLTSSVRNILYFNRSSSVFGIDYTIQQNSQKSLLTNGFDSRNIFTQEVRSRINIKKSFTLTTLYETGYRSNKSDFLSGRNYHIDQQSIKPQLTWQPGTTFRISVDFTYTEKKNKQEYGGEKSVIQNYGAEMRYSAAEKGSLLMNFNYVNIDYNGVANNSLSFEMLNALKKGENYTWGASWQQSLSKNMQLNLTYTGRKSENVKMIHSGGVQVRAFF